MATLHGQEAQLTGSKRSADGRPKVDQQEQGAFGNPDIKSEKDPVPRPMTTRSLVINISSKEWQRIESGFIYLVAATMSLHPIIDSENIKQIQRWMPKCSHFSIKDIGCRLSNWLGVNEVLAMDGQTLLPTMTDRIKIIEWSPRMKNSAGFYMTTPDGNEMLTFEYPTTAVLPSAPTAPNFGLQSTVCSPSERHCFCRSTGMIAFEDIRVWQLPNWIPGQLENRSLTTQNTGQNAVQLRGYTMGARYPYVGYITGSPTATATGTCAPGRIGFNYHWGLNNNQIIDTVYAAGVDPDTPADNPGGLQNTRDVKYITHLKNCGNFHIKNLDEIGGIPIESNLLGLKMTNPIWTQPISVPTGGDPAFREVLPDEQLNTAALNPLFSQIGVNGPNARRHLIRTDYPTSMNPPYSKWDGLMGINSNHALRPKLKPRKPMFFQLYPVEYSQGFIKQSATCLVENFLTMEFVFHDEYDDAELDESGTYHLGATLYNVASGSPTTLSGGFSHFMF